MKMLSNTPVGQDVLGGQNAERASRTCETSKSLPFLDPRGKEVVVGNEITNVLLDILDSLIVFFR